MNNTTIALMRFTHIVAAVYNLAFIYSPLHEWSHGFMVAQWISTPLLMLTGASLVMARKRAMARA